MKNHPLVIKPTRFINVTTKLTLNVPMPARPAYIPRPHFNGRPDPSELDWNLVPKTIWGSNLRTRLPKKDWDILRHETYPINAIGKTYLCEWCNSSGLLQQRKHPVECHEWWDYDDTEHIQKLEGLLCLCPLCHAECHYGRSKAVFSRTQLRVLHSHIKYLHCMDDEKLQEGIAHEFELWHKRSQHKWEQDLSWLATKEGHKVTHIPAYKGLKEINL